MESRLMPESLDIRTERVTGDTKVCLSPCYLYNVVIASNGDGEADAALRNGHGTGEDILLDLYCVDEAMAQLIFPEPVYFSRGLFVDVGTNVQSVVVQYCPKKE